MSIFSRALALFRSKAVEGAWHPGPYMLSDGWLPAGTSWNFWQQGQNVQPYGAGSSMVEACISRYSQTVAMCATEGDHWRATDDGGRERVTNSALARIIRKPNDYDSSGDFWLNMVRALYTTGNAYALGVENARFEIDQLHRMRTGTPRIAEDGSIFYDLSGNEIVEQRFDLSMPIPARDVLHIRLQTPRHPLKGESPILAAALAIAAGNAALQRQIAFFTNESKPSIILSTDAVLTKDQANDLRAHWNAQTSGDKVGGVPIVTAGLKPITISTNAHDAQLAESLKYSNEDVALAFGIPQQILGIGGTPYASTEAMMQAWRATGLGFALNQCEEALGRLFGLRGVPTEYVEFSTAVLLRSLFKERIEGLAAGVIGGLIAPDEGRSELELPKVPDGYGALPRMQRQAIPLNAWDKPPATAPAPAPLALPAPAAEPEGEEQDEAEDEKQTADAIVQRLYDHAGTLH